MRATRRQNGPVRCCCGGPRAPGTGWSPPSPTPIGSPSPNTARHTAQRTRRPGRCREPSPGPCTAPPPSSCTPCCPPTRTGRNQPCRLGPPSMSSAHTKLWVLALRPNHLTTRVSAVSRRTHEAPCPAETGNRAPWALPVSHGRTAADAPRKRMRRRAAASHRRTAAPG